MKDFKKVLAVLMAGLMLLSLAACGEKKDESLPKMGRLEATAVDGCEYREHIDTVHADDPKMEHAYYNNLSAMLMDLNSNKIMSIGVDKSIADFIVARNENLMSVILDTWKDNFSMMTMDSNQEVYDILNDAIKEMKADGTLDSLIENELKTYINSDPGPKDLPHFDGAKTIKIGVTGDLPPMDFVAANGKAAGFNIALLTEIANRAQVNFELVQIETDARAMALSSGKVDAVFWTRSSTCTKCGATSVNGVEGILATESYFTDYSASLKLKSDK
jgi:ABC-type amino acid transport substrate-binding protein